MVSRGTPVSSKTDLLLLDFLRHTERHELCRPAHLVCETAEVAESMTERRRAGAVRWTFWKPPSRPGDVVQQREESLAKQLAEMKAASAV